MEFNKKTQSELNNLISWLSVHEDRILSYKPAMFYNHPILRETHIIDNIIKAIKIGNLNVIELGCELVIENKKIPFGKGLKSQILRALKNQARFINQHYRLQLSELTVKLLSLEYHPTEIKYLCRLIKKFEPKYRQFVITQFNNTGNETQRWLKYLAEIRHDGH